jgi:hypothetical protein
MKLSPLQSELLATAKHGFFTRDRGFSAGIYSNLNCGHGSRDNPNNVKANREATARYFGHTETQLQSLHQIHSSDVVVLHAPMFKSQKADALVTATPGLTLSILTADCQPVLMYDQKAKVIGAAHAGWKGTKLGVLQNTIAAMETLGADRSEICAVIGPCISQKAYEVGPDFLDEVCADDHNAIHFFVQNKNGRYQFDLPGYGLSILKKENIKQFAWTGHCTYSNPTKFYSYRRSTHLKEPDYGRLINCISLQH